MAGSSSSSGLFQAGDMFHFEPISLPIPDFRMSELDGILGDFSDLPGVDFDNREDFQLTKVQQNERFGLPVSDADVDRAIAERVPEKTRRQTTWAVCLSELVQCTWRAERRSGYGCRYLAAKTLPIPTGGTSTRWSALPSKDSLQYRCRYSALSEALRVWTSRDRFFE